MCFFIVLCFSSFVLYFFIIFRYFSMLFLIFPYVPLFSLFFLVFPCASLFFLIFQYLSLFFLNFSFTRYSGSPFLIRPDFSTDFWRGFWPSIQCTVLLGQRDTVHSASRTEECIVQHYWDREIIFTSCYWFHPIFLARFLTRFLVQVFGQGFDQGFGAGKNRTCIVQYYPS